MSYNGNGERDKTSYSGNCEPTVPHHDRNKLVATRVDIGTIERANQTTHVKNKKVMDVEDTIYCR